MPTLIELAQSAEEIHDAYKKLEGEWITKNGVIVNRSTRYYVKSISCNCWLDATYLGNVIINDTQVFGPGQTHTRDISSYGFTVNKFHSMILWNNPSVDNVWRALQGPWFNAQPGHYYTNIGVVVQDPNALDVDGVPKLDAPMSDSPIENKQKTP